MDNKHKNENEQENSLTVASIIARGATCACIGYAVGWWLTDDTLKSLTGLVVGFIIGTFLRKRME